MGEVKQVVQRGAVGCMFVLVLELHFPQLRLLPHLELTEEVRRVQRLIEQALPLLVLHVPPHLLPRELIPLYRHHQPSTLVGPQMEVVQQRTLPHPVSAVYTPRLAEEEAALGCVEGREASDEGQVGGVELQVVTGGAELFGDGGGERRRDQGVLRRSDGEVLEGVCLTVSGDGGRSVELGECGDALVKRRGDVLRLRANSRQERQGRWE